MLDNKPENQNINLLPEGASEGISKGAEALGNGIGSAIQSFGQGMGYLAACIGDRIKYGKNSQLYPISTQLLLNSGNSKLLEVARSLSVNQEDPKNLVDSIQYEEEKNLRLFIKNVVIETIEREKNNLDLPTDFHVTDNVLAIEKAAAETNDEFLSQLWAKIFIEEALRPNSVTKASIEIVKKLDKKTAFILETQIFPYCTDDGWFLGMSNEFINAKMVAADNGILCDYNIESRPCAKFSVFEKSFCLLSIGDFSIAGHFGYNFRARDHLTKPALQLKNALKIYPGRAHMHQIEQLVNNPKFWWISDDYELVKVPDKKDYAILIDDTQHTIHSSKGYSTLDDYFSNISQNIKIKDLIND